MRSSLSKPGSPGERAIAIIMLNAVRTKKPERKYFVNSDLVSFRAKKFLHEFIKKVRMTQMIIK